ncbi:MAG: transcriptional regulator [Pseudomonadota bacterium]
MDSATPTANPAALVDALKRALRRQGLTYAAVATRMRLSEASIKRMLSRGRLSLEQMLQLADIAGTDLAELARQAKASARLPRVLGLEQERALAADPRLLLLFHLLVGGRSVEEIAREFDLRGTACTVLLARLDRLGLIELLPADRVRLRVAQDFAWRSDGPVRKRYGAQVLREFLHDRFDGERTLLRFEVRELSEASIDILRRKLQRLSAEVAELAELDAELPSARRHSVGVALAMRPWVFSIAEALKSKVDAGDAGAAALSEPRAPVAPHQGPLP